jgi:glycosyltransferase involved in cell wall biosynthesis
MRYAWDPEFLEGERLGPLARRLAPIGTAWLRRIDRRRAAGPDIFIANSTFVAGRIKEAYGRDSQVVHPPVDVDRMLHVPRAPEDAYLFFGRIVPYKRAEVAVAACERLGRRLIVAGGGRDLERVRSQGGNHVEFLGQVPDERVPELLARARAIVFPGVEDFGIVPVEAQAAGVPVIANAVGGARDSVLDGETGVLYEPGDVDGLCGAIERFEAMESGFDEQLIRSNARRFGAERFRGEFGSLLLGAAPSAVPPTPAHA